MTPEENKALVRRFVEETWNTGNLAIVDDVLPPEYLSHDPAAPNGTLRTREDFKHFVQSWRTAFPDMQVTIEDLIAEGDTVVDRVRWRETDQGEILGIEPTSARVELTEIHVGRVVEGRIVERWVASDLLGLLQQLGACPARP